LHASVGTTEDDRGELPDGIRIPLLSDPAVAGSPASDVVDMPSFSLIGRKQCERET
jgi:hypothetical protein